MTHRERAEALANKIIETITVHPTGDFDADEHDWNVHSLSRDEFILAMTNLIEAFAKAERAEECEAMKQHLENHLDWADITRADIYDWLDARLKEGRNG